MNRKLLGLIILIWLGALNLQAAIIYAVNSESRTLSRIDTDSQSIDNSFAQLGLTPNLMTLDEDHIWVVCSGDNTIQELDRQTGSLLRTLPVAPSCNPWDVLKIGDYLYVTGLFTDKLYKLSLASGTVVGSLQVGTAPEGLAAYGDLLFVANTGGYQNNYANSSVSVVDLSDFSVVNTIPVWSNPQYLKALDGRLHVSCTGNWSDLSGKIDVIDIPSQEHLARIDLNGRLMSVWFSSEGIALVGEALSTGFYRYDAHSLSILNSISNPLQPGAYAIDGNQELVALMRQNWGSPSLLYIRHPDLSAWQQYNLGLVCTDIKIYEAPTAVSDDAVTAPGLNLYPNPARRSELLKLDNSSNKRSELRLYNLRGQMIHSQILAPGLNELPLAPLTLAPGLYFYRSGLGKSAVSGRLIIR